METIFGTAFKKLYIKLVPVDRLTTVG